MQYSFQHQVALVTGAASSIGSLWMSTRRVYRDTLVKVGEPELYVGCCGWTEAQARYVTNFRTIELQTTFYQPPTSAVAKRWKSHAPPEFRFCMKAWQLI